jgi:hypothetical protein
METLRYIRNAVAVLATAVFSLSCAGPASASLSDTTAAVGAPAFWADGFLGGRGSSDTVRPALWIDDHGYVDPMNPALRGVDWERPSFGEDDPICSPSQPVSVVCSHGTEVASVALSQGVGTGGCPNGVACNSSDSTQRGVGYGVTSAMAPHFAAGCSLSALAWALGIAQMGGTDCDTPIAGAIQRATAVTESYERPSDGVVDLSLNADRAAFGLLPVAGAGDSGPAAGSVGSPCVGYDTLCVGAYDAGADPSSFADDSIFSWSSRGPGPLAVKKPDLVAVGGSYVADASYEYDKSLWRYDTGTSLAAPQVAGGAILLAGSGVTDHLAQKAILIDSARLGRATPAAAMGTQATWQPDWGWGALDLQAALAQRTNYATGSVPPGSARFFKTTTQAAGDRATLTWDMRETGFCDWSGPGCPSTGVVHALTNLDLDERDSATGALEASSASTVDNVEQVRATGAGSTVYAVRAPSSIESASAEPFAIAAKAPLTELAAPEPQIATTVSQRLAHDGEPVTISAAITNPSGDLAADNASATLDLPASVELVSGSLTQQLGTLAKHGQAGDAAVATWTVTGASDAVAHVRVVATAHAYGEQVQRTDDASTITFDSTPPRVGITAPSGAIQTTAADIGWSGSDATSGVDHFDVESATDGGPWTTWLGATTATNATWQGAAGHTYVFRARAVDALGNASDWVSSQPLSIVDAASNPDDVTYNAPGATATSLVTTTSWSPPTASGPATTRVLRRTAAGLRIVSVRTARGQLIVCGRIGPSAPLRGVVWVDGRVVTTSARAHRGTFMFRVRLPRHAGRFARVRVSYRGTPRYAPATARRRITIHV